MKYFRIRETFDLKDRWYLGPPYLNGVEVDPRLFTEGREYRGQRPLEFTIRRGARALGFTLGSFELPVVLPAVASHLQRCCGDSIEFIPASISGPGDQVEILNVINTIDAIDEKHSQITWWTHEDGVPDRIGTYAGVGRLTIRREAVSGAPVLRLKKWELPLIVSEVVKGALESIRTTGIVFQELAVS